MNETQIKNGGYLKFNRNNAINLFCRSCYGYDGHTADNPCGTPFKTAGMEVSGCPSLWCPIFYFRNGKDERPSRKLRIMTTEQKQKFLQSNKQRAQKSKEPLKPSKQEKIHSK
jgi:hypothetical protein